MFNSKKNSLLKTYWSEIKSYNKALVRNAEFIRRSEDHMGLEVPELLLERMDLLAARFSLLQVIFEVKKVKKIGHLE